MVCYMCIVSSNVNIMDRTATPGKLRRMQDAEAPSSSETEDDSFLTHDPLVQGAERAISSVVGKLDTSLSVEYTVNELIIEARDVGNLSRIFYGKRSLMIVYVF